MTKKNYLLGRGELLVSTVKPKSGGGPKNPPYSFKSAKKRVVKRLRKASERFAKLPENACPGNRVVAAITMHPRYVSKSDFPSDLLRAMNFHPVGGKTEFITPEKWGVQEHPESAVTDTWFVSFDRSSLEKLADDIGDWKETSSYGKQLQTIESFFAPIIESKIKASSETASETIYEVVLHTEDNSKILDAFYEFAEDVDSEVIKKRVRIAGGLVFVPVRSSQDSIVELAAFSFLRTVRPMPHLRTFRPPVLRSDYVEMPLLPGDNVLDESVRTVIFDGGLPDNSPLHNWVNYFEPSDLGSPVDELLAHGEAVTSACLFGHLLPESEIHAPFGSVDHVRVLDQNTGTGGDFELYDVLDRIIDHLDSVEQPYQFVNLSLGPDLSTEDDDIHPWTVELDQKANHKEIMITVAAGNSGERDAVLGLNRIQPPSDGANLFAIGACNKNEKDWQRCSYSSVGPGRTPGITKPDGVAFGGSFERPFGIISTDEGPGLVGTEGTSFSAPSVLRAGIGLHAFAGDELSPLAIRALLIHQASQDDNPQTEVGWGRIDTDPHNNLQCEDHEVTVIYQGELPLKEYLRASVPMPDEELSGLVTIKATLLIAPEVDPAFAHAYTRAGMDVVFRPNANKFDNEEALPKTDTFFSDKVLYKAPEYRLRGEGHKWEPCIKAMKKKRGSSLYKPVFDIYYHNRIEGKVDNEPVPLPYAFIVTVKAPKVENLYEQVLHAYSEILIPLEPRIEIPVSIL